MNYCILIELSRRTIAFSYFRDDGKNQFVPYGDELVKPLAIYSSGNELRIGKFAAEEAREGKAGAYDNIFDAIKKPASFSFRGTQYPLNKLLLFGIEQCLREFFESILYEMEGQLEQNTSKVPIYLLMSSELSENEQAYVVGLLRAAGYSNTCYNDYDSVVLDYVRTSLAKNVEEVIFVSTTGNDLFIECLNLQDAIHPKRVFDLSAKDAGKNPQIDQIVRLIWQDMQYDENAMNLVYEDCLPELQNQAQNFLDSGELMRQNVIIFNGHSYEYFLSRSSIAGIWHGADNALDNLLLQLRSKGVEPTKSAVVLLKSTSKNAYVKQSFSGFFPSVIIFDEKMHQKMLSSILESVKERNYILNDRTQKPAPPKDSSHTIDNRAFNREWRTVRGTVNGLIRNRRVNEARDALEIFINNYDNMGIDLSEVKSLLEDVKMLLKPEIKPLVVDAPKDVSPNPNDIKAYIREWRIASAEAKGYLREGKKEQARTLLEKFISDHKGMNNDDAKQMLSGIKEDSLENGRIDELYRNARQGKPSKQEETTEGEKLMKQLRFKEAREWFTERKLMAKAADCTSLIKATRQLKAFKAELSAIKSTRNLQLAKSHLYDMRGWRGIYGRYGLDTKEIDEIINIYNSIK